MIELLINQPEKDKKYIKRPGAYGIIKNVDNLIAVVKIKTGFFLPGGGIEDGESPDECLRRECLEEIGATISTLNNFAYGNYYFHSITLNTDIESEGYFFTCKIDKFLEIETEIDHELVWMEPEKAILSLYLDNQREAVRIFKTQNI